MPKLVLCIFAALLIGACLLQLRQQRLELGYQSNRQHSRLQQLQVELWNQQLQVAIYTAPNAIEQTVGRSDLQMVPESPLEAQVEGESDE